MKALILAAGRGSRLGSLSEGRNKCLVPVGGRPVISWSLANASAAGVNAVVIVVGYRAGDVITAVGDRYEDLPVRYVHQPAASGVVSAMDSAREALNGDDFLLFFADELMTGSRHPELVRQFARESLFALIGIVPESDPAEIRKTYDVRYDVATGRVTRLVEKPDHPAGGVRGTGNCVFRNGILDYVERTPVNPRRGEREFPDLVQCAIDDGRLVKAAPVADAYVNINTAEDLAIASARLSVPGA